MQEGHNVVFLHFFVVIFYYYYFGTKSVFEVEKGDSTRHMFDVTTSYFIYGVLRLRTEKLFSLS